MVGDLSLVGLRYWGAPGWVLVIVPALIIYLSISYLSKNLWYVMLFISYLDLYCFV